MSGKGRGVTRDDAQSVEWYRKAADQGDADAQTLLGRMYRKGRGVPQDYTQAVHWFRRGAQQGNVKAQFNLGFMYDNGQGVPQDYAQAPDLLIFYTWRGQSEIFLSFLKVPVYFSITVPSLV